MNTRTLTSADMMTPGRVLIKRKQLLQKVPLGERTILELERCGKFPKRFSITARSVAWDLNEVDAWIAEQQAAAVPQPAPGFKKP
ncbi:AlpA family transcriptional regulator [Massilia sp. YIM B04103]|uniref:helix-turn-helix transcriptional regulator n=1 Tax=Massilia sp. YIM B04103 TaxID=2963106 RepID=UPI002108CE65|nr:AlpA family phage regulatory protein [Massilia sp. YIM B04103]